MSRQNLIGAEISLDSHSLAALMDDGNARIARQYPAALSSGLLLSPLSISISGWLAAAGIGGFEVDTPYRLWILSNHTGGAVSSEGDTIRCRIVANISRINADAGIRVAIRLR